jgi:hypothetical protein
MPQQEQEEAWYYEYSAHQVSNVVVHGKNDRHQGASPLKFIFPRGPLTKLFLAHVLEGQHILTLERAEPMSRLFVTRLGKEYSDATFSQHWKYLLEGTSTLKYFPPSSARTVFVEDYTSKFGVEPEMWDGAAAIMGNTVRQWGASYNPSRRQRIAQRAVDGHAEYSTRRANEAGPSRLG